MRTRSRDHDCPSEPPGDMFETEQCECSEADCDTEGSSPDEEQECLDDNCETSGDEGSGDEGPENECPGGECEPSGDGPSGDESDEVAPTPECQDGNCDWSEWCGWSDCVGGSVPNCFQVRVRKCECPNPCPGEDLEMRPCECTECKSDNPPPECDGAPECDNKDECDTPDCVPTTSVSIVTTPAPQVCDCDKPDCPSECDCPPKTTPPPCDCENPECPPECDCPQAVTTTTTTSTTSTTTTTTTTSTTTTTTTTSSTIVTIPDYEGSTPDNEGSTEDCPEGDCPEEPCEEEEESGEGPESGDGPEDSGDGPEEPEEPEECDCNDEDCPTTCIEAPEIPDTDELPTPACDEDVPEPKPTLPPCQLDDWCPWGSCSISCSDNPEEDRGTRTVFI